MKFNTYGEYCTRYACLKEHPNAIVRKNKVTGFYIAFYDHTTFQYAISQKAVAGY